MENTFFEELEYVLEIQNCERMNDESKNYFTKLARKIIKDHNFEVTTSPSTLLIPGGVRVKVWKNAVNKI